MTPTISRPKKMTLQWGVLMDRFTRGGQKAWLRCLIAVKCEKEQEKESKIISGIVTWAEINSGRGTIRKETEDAVSILSVRHLWDAPW